MPTLTARKRELRATHPHWTESKVKRVAEKQHREEYIPDDPNPLHINGIHTLHDPTPADAIRNIRNDLAAARRLGLA